MSDNSKTKCFISGPDGCFEDTKKVTEILEAAGYAVSSPFEMLEGGRPLIDFTEAEIRSYRNRMINECGHLILLDGWQKNQYSKADHGYAYERGIGISYASEMELLKAHRLHG